MAGGAPERSAQDAVPPRVKLAMGKLLPMELQASEAPQRTRAAAEWGGWNGRYPCEYIAFEVLLLDAESKGDSPLRETQTLESGWFQGWSKEKNI